MECYYIENSDKNYELLSEMKNWSPDMYILFFSPEDYETLAKIVHLDNSKKFNMDELDSDTLQSASEVGLLKMESIENPLQMTTIHKATTSPLLVSIVDTYLNLESLREDCDRYSDLHAHLQTAVAIYGLIEIKTLYSILPESVIRNIPFDTFTKVAQWRGHYHHYLNMVIRQDGTFLQATDLYGEEMMSIMRIQYLRMPYDNISYKAFSEQKLNASSCFYEKINNFMDILLDQGTTDDDSDDTLFDVIKHSLNNGSSYAELQDAIREELGIRSISTDYMIWSFAYEIWRDTPLYFLKGYTRKEYADLTHLTLSEAFPVTISINNSEHYYMAPIEQMEILTDLLDGEKYASKYEFLTALEKAEKILPNHRIIKHGKMLTYFQLNDYKNALMIAKDLSSDYPHDQYLEKVVAICQIYLQSGNPFHSLVIFNVDSPEFLQIVFPAVVALKTLLEKDELEDHTRSDYYEFCDAILHAPIDWALEHNIQLYSIMLSTAVEILDPKSCSKLIAWNSFYLQQISYYSDSSEGSFEDDTISELGEYVYRVSLHQEWPAILNMFGEIIAFYTDNDLLNHELTINIIDSAHTSYESWLMHTDYKISRSVSGYLLEKSNLTDARRLQDAKMEKDAANEIALFEYDVLMDYPDCISVIEHIKERYPYTYERIAKLHQKMISSASIKRLQESSRTRAVNVVRQNKDIQMKAMKQISSDYFGFDTSSLKKSISNRNSTPKIGRNDPCPCGSGKKYKKCCGK